MNDRNMRPTMQAAPSWGLQFSCLPFSCRSESRSTSGLGRPHLAEFLDFAFANFAVGVWSSATESYVAVAVREVIGRAAALRFVWSVERCTRRFDGERHEEYWVKDLKKLRRLGYSLDRILFVDDSPEKLERNFGNLVPVQPFFGDAADSELRDLVPFLDRLRGCSNVRNIEKRNWRTWRRE